MSVRHTWIETYPFCSVSRLTKTAIFNGCTMCSVGDGVCVCQLWPCVAILAQVPFLTAPLLAVVCFSWSSKWTCSQWVTLRSVNDCTLPLSRASGMKTSNTCGGMTPNKSSGRRSTSYQPMGHSIVRPAYYQHPVQATWHTLSYCFIKKWLLVLLANSHAGSCTNIYITECASHVGDNNTIIFGELNLVVIFAHNA